MGGDRPVLIQSMCNTPTMDTRACVEQCIRIIEAGAGMVRLATRNPGEARNIRSIKEELIRSGYHIPIVADVHFSQDTALEAALYADKVRMNPGNFAREDIETPFMVLLERCRDHETAIRIGVNHGSLSERIMQDYGDTPRGMVESAMEYLRLCISAGFRNAAVSLKSSNTRVMIQANRMLVRKMLEEGMNFPVHLGVTEAGEGEDGRMRSATGIGTLLNEGIGDTIRVSLTEAPEHEIPVARIVLDTLLAQRDQYKEPDFSGPEFYFRRESIKQDDIGGCQPPVVIGSLPASGLNTKQDPDYLFIKDHKLIQHQQERARIILNAEQWANNNYPEERFFPLFTLENFLKTNIASKRLNFVLVSPLETIMVREKLPRPGFPSCLVCVYDSSPAVRTAINRLVSSVEMRIPVIIMAEYTDRDPEMFAIRSATELSCFFTDGYADGLWLKNPLLERNKLYSTTFKMLQASRARMTETEYIACPSCARTLFDIQERLTEVKKATSHLRKLKIAVMGCIVNGPGEMADADYGYVGAGTGTVNLYKGKECIRKNIPEKEALDEMILIMKKFGDWKKPGNNDH